MKIERSPNPTLHDCKGSVVDADIQIQNTQISKSKSTHYAEQLTSELLDKFN